MGEQTDKRPKYINLLTDYGFKRVFGNAEVMIAFLNDLLEPKSRICDVIFADKEMSSSNKYERGVVYDLRCKLDDGSEIIVEMQKGEQEFFADRILYYLSRSVAMQGYKGKMPKQDNHDVKVDWNFELRPVYGIFFMNFSIANLEPSPLREVGFYVKGTDNVFCDKIKAYTIELTEYRKNKESDCKGKLEYWTYIINNMERLNDMPFIPQMPIFGKVENLASTAAMTPEDFEAYQDSVDAYRTTMAAFEFHEKKGREEERQKAYEDKLSCARSFKALGALTIKQIAESLGLTEDEVMKA